MYLSVHIPPSEALTQVQLPPPTVSSTMCLGSAQMKEQDAPEEVLQDMVLNLDPAKERCDMLLWLQVTLSALNIMPGDIFCTYPLGQSVGLPRAGDVICT